MKEASPAFCSPHFFVIEKLIRLFELTIRAQLLFITVLEKLNQGARKKRAVYRFFLDFSLVTFFVSRQRK